MKWWNEVREDLRIARQFTKGLTFLFPVCLGMASLITAFFSIPAMLRLDGDIDFDPLTAVMTCASALIAAAIAWRVAVSQAAVCAEKGAALWPQRTSIVSGMLYGFFAGIGAMFVFVVLVFLIVVCAGIVLALELAWSHPVVAIMCVLALSFLAIRRSKYMKHEPPNN